MVLQSLHDEDVDAIQLLVGLTVAKLKISAR
jgi:hypothetical protein